MWQVNNQKKDFYTQVSNHGDFVKVQEHIDNFTKYLDNGKISKVYFQGDWVEKEVDYLPHEFMEWVA
jgi:hypothetical protein